MVGSTLIGASPVAMFFSPMNGSSMLGWVVEVEAALGCAGKGHMRFHKMAAPADELTSARCRVLTWC